MPIGKQHTHINRRRIKIWKETETHLMRIYT